MGVTYLRKDRTKVCFFLFDTNLYMKFCLEGAESK